MGILGGLASFMKDSMDGIRDATTEVVKGNIETTKGVLTREMTLTDAINKNTGHAIAATSKIISPRKFISLVTQATDAQLVAPLAEFKEIMYSRCDDNVKPADMELALFVLVVLQKMSPRPFPEMEEYRAASDAKFAEFKHWLKHSTAAYGRNPLIHEGYISAGCKDDKAWIAHFTGIQRADILRYEDTMDIQQTDWLEHYLAIDRARSAVVLAIKGTITLKGIMTDLDCTYTKRGNYKYHGGLFKAATALVDHIQDDLTRALGDNPTFKLVTCGHSLGGGVAALVAHILSYKMPDGRFVTKKEGRDIHCYAIEPAASMCAQASADYQGLISSLVHKNDIVPSLSDGVLEDIKTYAGYLKDHPDYLGKLLIKASKMATSFGNSKEADEFLNTFRELATHEKLVPPGMVYVMAKKDRLYYGRVSDAAVAKHFGEAKFLIGMIMHHWVLSIDKTMKKF